MALQYTAHHFKDETSIGALDIQCQHCQAKKFRDETKGMCCSNEKVKPDPFPPLPHTLSALFKGANEEYVRSLRDIRKYNSVLQLTSLGCKEIRVDGWNPHFRVQGQVWHLIGALEPYDESHFSGYLFTVLLYGRRRANTEKD